MWSEKLKGFLIKSIEIYQKKRIFIAKRSCVFYPTCSEYTKEAIQKYGLRGLWLGLLRVFRCHPWQKNHIDLLK